MPWTASDVVDEVRGLHAAFDEQAVPSTTLRRAINRYHAELYSRMVDVNPHLFTSTETIDFPLSSFDDGYTLPDDFNTPQGGDIFWDSQDGSRRLNLIPFGNRHHPGCRWPAYILGPKIYFVGEENDWTPVDKVELYYIPEPAELTDLSTQADLPDRAKRVIVERAAIFAAGRSNSVSQEQLQTELAISDWRDSQEQLLNEIDRGSKVETAYVRDVW